MIGVKKMLYAAMVFWLSVSVFVAYAIYQIWAGLLKPKVLNFVLFPGTVVAQAAHVLGLLLAGGTLNNVALFRKDEKGRPTKRQDIETRIPVFGPIVVAALPIVACAFSIFMVVDTIGADVMLMLQPESTVSALPMTFGSVWELLRGSITLVEQITREFLNIDFNQWRTWLFMYLLVCLTVRLAPLPGMQRASIGAVVVLGIAAALIIVSMQMPEERVQSMWKIANLSVGTLFALLGVSLVARWSVSFYKTLSNKP